MGHVSSAALNMNSSFESVGYLWGYINVFECRGGSVTFRFSCPDVRADCFAERLFSVVQAWLILKWYVDLMRRLLVAY